MTIGWHFDNTYSKLPESFREKIKPIPVNSPELVILNESLAYELDLNFSKIDKKEYPLILTTSRVLQHYNAATMTRRTKNINIVNEDVLLIHPKDAALRDINTGDIGRLYSGRGEVALKVEVTDKVKEGIVFTTFHFPEHMVNMVTGHGKDEETMCAEYKVSSVEVQKISNQFKTEVKPKENQAEVS